MQISFLLFSFVFPVHFVDHSLSQMITWKTLGSFGTHIYDRLWSTKGTEKGKRIKRNEICIFAKILFYFYSIPIFISYMFHIIFLFPIDLFKEYIGNNICYNTNTNNIMSWTTRLVSYILFDSKEYTRK